MIFTLARATGWDEQTLMWMPLRRSLQYLHAAWLNLGTATEWRTESEESTHEKALLFEKLRYLTKQNV